MSTQPHIDPKTGISTVGHEWDGIEELDTPMPRWWLWMFFACVVFAIGYVIVYPALPGLTGATKGIWGWTSRGQLADETKAAEAARAPIRLALANTPIAQLPANPALMKQAVEGGRAAFRVNCIQCHGTGAAGSRGYPNLNDDDWLWGGDLATIETTITHGIRAPGDAATRKSQMPAFGRDGILQPAQAQDLVSYVRTLSHQDGTNASSQRGGTIFTANCAVCHGADGKGSRTVGAPNLTDGIWLYGGDRASQVDSVTNAHQGVMPNWGPVLDPVTIKMLAAYVHSLGGGEAAPAASGTTPMAGTTGGK